MSTLSEPHAASNSPRAIRARGRWTGWAARLTPSVPAIVILVLAVLWGAHVSPYFLDADSLLTNTSRYAEVGLFALALTLVIINGDIDLSVASNMAVCAAVLGLAAESGVPIALACGLAVLTGVALGAFNGLLITAFGLPSLVVTLGTLALFRGVAQVILRDRAITAYPDGFLGADQFGLLGTTPDIRLPLAILLALGIAFWWLLEHTSFGLSCFLTGSNEPATRFSGISTRRTRFVTFCLAGLMAGVAAILITSRLGSTRSNLGFGMELPAITVVVLGGTSIAGGIGSIQASLLALLAVMAVREALVIDNVNGQTQDAVIGLILIAAILVPRLVATARLSHSSRRRRRPRPPTSTTTRVEDASKGRKHAHP